MNTEHQTVDDLVMLFHPRFVNITYPKKGGLFSIEDAKVKEFTISYDEVDGVHLYVTLL